MLILARFFFLEP